MVFCHFSLCFKWIVAYNEGNKMCTAKYEKKTISCATDNGIQNTSISFKYIYIFLLSFTHVLLFFSCTPLLCSMFVGVFLPKKKAAKATDMTIILWITKCNYCPPTKFLIYDQILDPFKSPNLLAQELMNWRMKKQQQQLDYNVLYKCLYNKVIYTFFIWTGINATRTLNFCLSGRKCYFLYNSYSNMVYIVLLLLLLLFVDDVYVTFSTANKWIWWACRLSFYVRDDYRNASK